MRSINYEKNLVKLLFNHKVDGKIETHYGSGVIVKPFESSKYLYIFTAKHTFEKEERSKDYPDEIERILFDDEYIKSNLIIEMSTPCSDKPNRRTGLYPSYVDNISKIIQVENKELDLLIFEICIEDRDVDICPLNISKNTFDEVVVAGFPSIRDGLPYGYDSSLERYYDKSETYVEFKSKESLSTKDTNEYDAIKGISGGGVFIEKENQIYLVGVQIGYQAPNSFKCINLNTIYKEINTILKSRTEIYIMSIGDFFDIEMVKVDLPDKSLYVSIYPVSFGEYDLFCEDIGEKNKKPSSEGFGRGKNPVININWDNAIAYCSWLSKQDGNAYTLLSLSEWKNIAEYVIFNENDIWCGENKVIEVDKLNPNNLGLYHFYGNVNEWCNDDNKKYRIAIGGSYCNKNLERQIKKSPSRPSSKIGFRTIFVST